MGPMTIKALAAEMVMDRTTLGRSILLLDRDGLIVVEEGSRDRRSGSSWTDAVTRGCATLRANVDHSLVSVCGETEATAVRENNGAPRYFTVPRVSTGHSCR